MVFRRGVWVRGSLIFNSKTQLTIIVHFFSVTSKSNEPDSPNQNFYGFNIVLFLFVYFFCNYLVILHYIIIL